jgi:hypothetical protein
MKAIAGGRLKGKSDINPQWRMQAITEVFGPVGFGWSYTIDKLWTEPGTAGEICSFALVSVKVKMNGEWSEPVPGIGGNLLVELEKAGPHTNDEAYKMAVTDGLSVAFKAFGVAAEVYLGNFDGSKYTGKPATGSQSPVAQTPDHERVKASLHSLFGADKKAALDQVEKMTAFQGKDGPVAGVRDFTKLTGKRLEILADKLDKMVVDKRADVPDLCALCRQPMTGGKCHNTDCLDGPDPLP